MTTACKTSSLASGPGLRFLGLLVMMTACADPSATPPVIHDPGQVIAASDLLADARQAASKKIPILIVITRHDCPYCALIKEKILRPMLLSGDYENQVSIRELMIDPVYTLRDFNGQMISSADLAARFEAVFTPTVLLLDPSGTEVADRLLGINTTELYGYYLDEAIGKARIAMNTDEGGATR